MDHTLTSQRRSISGQAVDAYTLDETGIPFACWLMRPLIDLGPFEEGPLFIRGIPHYVAALNDLSLPDFGLQRTLPARFRNSLLEQYGMRQYCCADPRELLGTVHTEGWELLCKAVADFQKLDNSCRCRVLALLHALCLYPLVAQLAGTESCAAKIRIDDSRMSYWLASAEYMISADRSDHHGIATAVDRFAALTSSPMSDERTAFSSAIKVFVHEAKHRANLRRLRYWKTVAQRRLESLLPDATPFVAHLLQSRFYRAIAFLPQMEGRRDEMIELMDRAENHALRLEATNAAEQLILDENLHPVLESRVKEAIYLKKIDLAETRARKLVALDPLDSKAWLELGEVYYLASAFDNAASAYLMAATLGPPGNAIGRHQAAVCFEHLDRPTLAAACYQDVLRIDPNSYSARQRLCRLSIAGTERAIRRWCTSTAGL